MDFRRKSSFFVVVCSFIGVCWYFKVKIKINLDYRSPYDDISPYEEELDRLEKTVPLYLITPTHPRVSQLMDMMRNIQMLQVKSRIYFSSLYVSISRISHTHFKLIPNFTWLISEDINFRNYELEKLLQESGLPYHYFKGLSMNTVKIRKVYSQCE